MNLSPDWAKAFAEADIQATHWSQIGACDDPDTAIIAYAQDHHAVIPTNDVDFGEHLVSSNASKPSIVQLRMEELDPRIVGQEVIAIMIASKDELRRGALITIKPNRTRSRLLPFRVQ